MKLLLVVYNRANAVFKPIQMVAKYHPPPSINFKRKDLIMKKYVVEVVEKITYKVTLDAASSEEAENAASRIYDLGALEDGELESVTFDVEEQEGK